MKKIYLFMVLLFSSYNAMALTCAHSYKPGDGYNHASMWIGNENSATLSLYLSGTLIGSASRNGGSISYGGQIYTIGAVQTSACNNGKNCNSMIYSYQYCYAPAVAYSYTTTQDQAAACPATRPSGYILQRRTYEVWTDGSARNFGAWYNVADYCSAVYSYTGYQNQNVGCPATRPSGYIVQQRSYQVYTDGSVINYSGWTNIADYCTAVYSYTGYNYTTSACPVTTPSGVINMAQSYQVFTDGTVKNYSAWYATSNTCIAVYQSTQSQTQTLACAAPYAEGGNGITQTQTRQIWSDGAKTWSDWATTSNTCYKTISDVRNNKTTTCAEGQTGSIVTQEVRTHKEYIADTTKVPALTPAQIAALNDQNGTTWTTVTLSNTCVNMADKVTTGPGTRALTCAAAYGGSNSDYTGSVIESGTNIYTYSSVTKQTTMVFQSTSPKPTYNSTCKMNALSDVTIINSTRACDNGMSGVIKVIQYVRVDASGNKTLLSQEDVGSTCVNNNASTDTSVSTPSTALTKGLLSNITIKSTSLSNKTDMLTFIKTLDKNTIDADANYKLNLIVDDLSTGSYNKTNVSNTVAAFKGVTGKDPIITVPQTLDKYIGNGGITANNVKTKVLKSAIINNNNQVVVTYGTLTKGLQTSTDSSFTVNLLQ